MYKKDRSFKKYQNLKIPHADPDHLFLAIIIKLGTLHDLI